VQREAVDDYLLVVADADGQGAQAGLVVGFHGGEPGFQVAAAGAGRHHLGEGGHVPGERVDVRHRARMAASWGTSRCPLRSRRSTTKTSQAAATCRYSMLDLVRELRLDLVSVERNWGTPEPADRKLNS
jgi:hypothetical protein